MKVTIENMTILLLNGKKLLTALNKVRVWVNKKMTIKLIFNLKL